MQHSGNVIRLVVVVALAFVVYQVVLTPAQRTVVTETVQQAANSSVMPSKTVIQVVSTAAPVPTVVIRPIVQQQPAQVASEPLQEVAPTTTVGNDPPGCIVTTDYRDGHQFCNDGRGFSDDDPRKQPGYCNAVPVGGGWWECEGGQYMAAIVNLPAAEPTSTPWPTAAPADYIVSNGCVTAISNTKGVPITICPPAGTTWQDGEELGLVAQMIIDGKFDNNTSGQGPKG